MAKRIDSRYEPGRRSPAWRKVKIRGRQEFVIGGWSTGQGNRSGVLGSLVLGYHHPDDADGPLVYAGNVGTGFTAAELTRVQAELDALASDDCPFAPVAAAADRPHVALGAAGARRRGCVHRMDAGGSPATSRHISGCGPTSCRIKSCESVREFREMPGVLTVDEVCNRRQRGTDTARRLRRREP